MTSLSPSLRKGTKHEYANAYHSINNYQMDKDIPILPLGLFDLVSPIFNPVYVAYSPSTSNIEEYYKKLAVYKEELRLQNIELEVTEWITMNKVPKMGYDERTKLVDDLKVINDCRHEEGEIDLDLDKTLAEHLTSLEDEQKKKATLREQRRPVIDDSSDSCDSSTFASSDSSDGYDSSGNPKVDAAQTVMRMMSYLLHLMVMMQLVMHV